MSRKISRDSCGKVFKIYEPHFLSKKKKKENEEEKRGGGGGENGGGKRVEEK